jgi:hypothetical protein
MNVAYPTSRRARQRTTQEAKSEEDLDYCEVTDTVKRVVTNSDSDHEYEYPLLQ